MHDDLVDRALSDLAKALDVTPSPQFAANVRARITAGQAAGGWHLWAIAGVGVAAAIVVGIVMLPRLTSAPSPRESRQVLTVARPPSAESRGVRRNEKPATVVLRDARPHEVFRQPAFQTLAYGDVLVPPDQAIALSRLLTGIRAGRMAVPSDVRAPVDADGLLLAPERIQVPLIDIAPIPADEIDGPREK